MDRLLQRGHHVRALVRPASSLNHLGWPPSVEIFRANDGTGFDKSFDGINALVHLAACVSGDEDVQFQSSVIGTERLLKAMEGTSCKRVVYASSIVVYDWSRLSGEVDVDDPLDDDIYKRDGYDVAKLWQERVVYRSAQANGWELTVLRPGFIWGRGNEYLFGIGRSIERIHVVVGPLNHLPPPTWRTAPTALSRRWKTRARWGRPSTSSTATASSTPATCGSGCGTPAAGACQSCCPTTWPMASPSWPSAPAS